MQRRHTKETWQEPKPRSNTKRSATIETIKTRSGYLHSAKAHTINAENRANYRERTSVEITQNKHERLLMRVRRYNAQVDAINRNLKEKNI